MFSSDLIADLKSADEVSTADAKDARIEHGASAGWLAPVELEPKRKKVREIKQCHALDNALDMRGRRIDRPKRKTQNPETDVSRLAGAVSIP